jgi:uncharacterized membrane protein
MMTLILFAAAIGSALIGGVFFAFSTFVMRALAQIPDAQGIVAMQRINVVVLNPLFLGVFIGTAALSLALIVYSVCYWSAPDSPLLLLGSVAYLVGAFGVTLLCNVPRNNHLATVDPHSPAGIAYWRASYLIEWVLWNHVRTMASLLAAVLLIFALR